MIYINQYLERGVMKRECNEPVRSFLPLRPNWFHILVSLAREDRHGYAIMQEVGERTDGALRLWPATLYGSIRRMSEAGLIGECQGRPRQDDPRRRYYRISPLGRAVLEAEANRLEHLAEMARAVRPKAQRSST